MPSSYDSAGALKLKTVSELETLTRTENTVFAGPAVAPAAVPTFRALAAADLPTIGATKGGTGQTTYATGDVLYASGANTLAKLAAGTNGHVLTMGASVPAWSAAANKTRLLYGTEQATGTSLTYSMPASTMDNDGDVLVVYGRGITATSQGETVRLRLGSTTIFTRAISAGIGDAAPWEFTARIIRTGASAQTCYRSISSAATTSATGVLTESPGARITATEALTSGTLDLILDYSTAGSADRIVHYLEVELREAP